MKMLIQLVRKILHLSGKSQGRVRELQKPRAVATMRKLNFEANTHSLHLVLQCTGFEKSLEFLKKS